MLVQRSALTIGSFRSLIGLIFEVSTVFKEKCYKIIHNSTQREDTWPISNRSGVARDFIFKEPCWYQTNWILIFYYKKKSIIQEKLNTSMFVDSSTNTIFFRPDTCHTSCIIRHLSTNLCRFIFYEIPMMFRYAAARRKRKPCFNFFVDQNQFLILQLREHPQ